MKIAIETFPVKLALRRPFIIASIANYWMFYVIVKVTMDSGVVGYGEAIPAWEVTGETQFSVIDAIGHLCEPTKTGITLIGKGVGTLDAEGYGIPCQVGSMLENKLGTAMLLHTFYCHKNLKTIEAGFFGEIADPIGEGISITERKITLTPSARGGHGISLNDDAILPKLIVRQDSILMNNIVFGVN